jgi:hypothetical protein
MRPARFWAAVVALIIGLTTLGVAGERAASAAGSTYTHGYDISWPQCHGSSASRLPGGRQSYVILGLTNGTGHTVNPCLRSQLHWARAHRAKVGGYVVGSFPSRRQRLRAGYLAHCGGHVMCRLLHDGANQATDALRTMHRVHMRSPMLWLDIEFRSSHSWLRNRHYNRAVVEGMVMRLRAAHQRIGVYTTSYMWHHIVGNYRLNVPQWLPSGLTSARHTKPMCRQTATGGRTWLVQYTRHLDEDLTCPVMDATRAHVRGGHGYMLSRMVA